MNDVVSRHGEYETLEWVAMPAQSVRRYGATVFGVAGGTQHLSCSCQQV